MSVGTRRAQSRPPKSTRWVPPSINEGFTGQAQGGCPSADNRTGGHGDAVRIQAGSLTTAGDAPELFGRFPMYAAGLQWLERFVTRPHPDLGRHGAVCPRLTPALQADTIWLAAIDPGDATLTTATAVGRLAAQIFRDLADGPHWQSSALMAFFPGLPEHLAGDFIDGGHKLLRPWFVEQGLMLGEFHPTSVVTSVRNQELEVMRCPVPMFVVRALTVHDVLFLDQPQIPAALRLKYLRWYREHLGSRLNPAGLRDLDIRISDTRQVLNTGEDR